GRWPPRSHPPYARSSQRTSGGAPRPSRPTSSRSSSARSATCRARRRSTTSWPCEDDFLAVRGRHGIPDASALPGEPIAAAEAGETEENAPAVTLFPPGPLAHVEIAPARSRVERLGERRLRARATDAEGQRVTGGECTSSVTDGPGRVAASG